MSKGQIRFFNIVDYAEKICKNDCVFEVTVVYDKSFEDNYVLCCENITGV